MSMEIAVLVDQYHHTSSFEKDGTIEVYRKHEQEWKLIRTISYCIEEIKEAASLRRQLGELALWLGDCRIILVKRIRGIHYLALEEHQISLLEAEGSPEDLLDLVENCMSHQRTGEVIPLEPKAIYQQSPGHFYVDLTDVMKGNTSYSSKQLLLPFLKKEDYQSLEIICEHVPRWMDKEQSELGIAMDITKYKSMYKVIVTPVK